MKIYEFSVSYIFTENLNRSVLAEDQEEAREKLCQILGNQPTLLDYLGNCSVSVDLDLQRVNPNPEVISDDCL